MTEREYHSVSAFHLEANCVWILVFGGIADDPDKADTAIIELSEYNYIIVHYTTA